MSPGSVTASGGDPLADTRSSANSYPKRVHSWAGLSGYLSGAAGGYLRRVTRWSGLSVSRGGRESAREASDDRASQTTTGPPLSEAKRRAGSIEAESQRSVGETIGFRPCVSVADASSGMGWRKATS